VEQVSVSANPFGVRALPTHFWERNQLWSRSRSMSSSQLRRCVGIKPVAIVSTRFRNLDVKSSRWPVERAEGSDGIEFPPAVCRNGRRSWRRIFGLRSLRDEIQQGMGNLVRTFKTRGRAIWWGLLNRTHLGRRSITDAKPGAGAMAGSDRWDLIDEGG